MPPTSLACKAAPLGSFVYTQHTLRYVLASIASKSCFQSYVVRSLSDKSCRQTVKFGECVCMLCPTGGGGGGGGAVDISTITFHFATASCSESPDPSSSLPSPFTRPTNCRRKGLGHPRLSETSLLPRPKQPQRRSLAVYCKRSSLGLFGSGTRLVSDSTFSTDRMQELTSTRFCASTVKYSPETKPQHHMITCSQCRNNNPRLIPAPPSSPHMNIHH